MPWDALTPYDDLPDLPPPGELESKSVLKLVIEARAALARLDQATALIPNPTVLLNTIPLLEAQASSEIENIVTTEDDLFRYAQNEGVGSDPATKETLRYRTALYQGIADVRSRALTANTAAKVCSVIKQRDMGVRRLSGTRIANPTSGEVIYAPPEGHDLLLAKLSNWERFVHGAAELDPLVRMAVAHYQFEAIHPFDDGNGRTGRILNILMLMEAGLLSHPVLYLSRYIIKNKNDYYRLLRGVTADGSWEPWVQYLVSGVRVTADSATRKITAIRDLQRDVTERIRPITGAGRNAEFRDVMFEQPYVRIQTVMAACDVSRPTAAGWLNAVVAQGVLHDLRVGRDRLFVNPRFLDLLVRDEPE
ncbi:MAG: Fic family protein [Propionibacteriaceae bacterium]